MDRFGRGEIDVDDMAALEWDLERNAPVTELEIDRENEGLLLRQRNYRRAAETVAGALGQHPGVQRVVLFGSVARPLKKEMPRFSRFRRARIALWHECRDIDLAVWVTDLPCAGELRRIIAATANGLVFERGSSVPHHAFDVYLIEPDTNRYRGMVCHYATCPKQKPECYEPGCGAVKFVRQFRGDNFDPSIMMRSETVTLFERAMDDGGRRVEDDWIPF